QGGDRRPREWDPSRRGRVAARNAARRVQRGFPGELRWTALRPRRRTCGRTPRRADRAVPRRVLPDPSGAAVSGAAPDLPGAGSLVSVPRRALHSTDPRWNRSGAERRPRVRARRLSQERHQSPRSMGRTDVWRSFALSAPLPFDGVVRTAPLVQPRPVLPFAPAAGAGDPPRGSGARRERSARAGDRPRGRDRPGFSVDRTPERATCVERPKSGGYGVARNRGGD